MDQQAPDEVKTVSDFQQIILNRKSILNQNQSKQETSKTSKKPSSPSLPAKSPIYWQETKVMERKSNDAQRAICKKKTPPPVMKRKKKTIPSVTADSEEKNDKKEAASDIPVKPKTKPVKRIPREETDESVTATAEKKITVTAERKNEESHEKSDSHRILPQRQSDLSSIFSKEMRANASLFLEKDEKETENTNRFKDAPPPVLSMDSGSHDSIPVQHHQPIQENVRNQNYYSVLTAQKEVTMPKSSSLPTNSSRKSPGRIRKDYSGNVNVGSVDLSNSNSENEFISYINVQRSSHGMNDSHVVTITGSSSESDYSGDGYVRRPRKYERPLYSDGTSTKRHVPPRSPQKNQISSPTRKHHTSSNSPSIQRSHVTEETNWNSQENHYDQPICQRDAQDSIENSISIKSATSDEETDLRALMKLHDFVLNYSHLLPSQVEIKEGIYSTNNELYIAKGEIFNFHFLKNLKVVTLQDNEDQEVYSIPINSSLYFGLFFSPSPDDIGVSSHMYFRTAGDVMKLKRLPLIITATANFDGGSPKKSVSKDEILFVKQIIKHNNFSGGRKLYVVNTNNEEKYLSSKCAGYFSTDPKHMKLHLSTMFSHGIQLPQHVVMYPDEEIRKCLPVSMINTPVLLESLKDETSVIATCGEIENIGTDESQLFDINLSLDIKVKQVHLSDLQIENLKDATDSIYQNFEAGKSQLMVEKKSTRALDLQGLFYHKLLEDAKEGIHLHMPSQKSPQESSLPDSVQNCEDESASLIQEDTVVNKNPETVPPSMQADVSSVSSFTSDTVSNSHFISGTSQSNSNAEGENKDEGENIDKGENKDDGENKDEGQNKDEDGDAIYEDIDTVLDHFTEENIVEEVKEEKNRVFKLFKKKRNEEDKDYPSSVSLEKEAVQSPTHCADYKNVRGDYFSDNYYDVEIDSNTLNISGPHEEEESSHQLVPDLKTKNELSKKSLISEEVADNCNYEELGTIPEHTMKQRGKVRKQHSMNWNSTFPKKLKVPSTASISKLLRGGSPKAPPTTTKTPTQSVVPDNDEISFLNERVSALKKELEELKLQMSDLSSTVENLSSKLQKPEITVGDSVKDGGKWAHSTEENIKFVESMNLEQVMELLDAMDIPQYKQHFKKEQVNGTILAILDDEMLKDDLKVGSKLHRIRLLKVFSGDISVSSCMSELCKYVQRKDETLI